MNLTIPLYVHLHDDVFTVRPLFMPRPVERHEKLERVLFQLGRELRKQLNEFGKAWRHDGLAAYSFCPDLEYRRFDLDIELRRRVAHARFLVVIFEWQDRRVAFTPSVPNLWFEVQRGEAVDARAREALTHHFRAREKEDPDDFLTPEKAGLQGTAWITTLDVDVFPTPQFAEPEQRRRASLGSEDAVEGEAELYRVGRCLDHLYPDELDRVLLRERQVQELTRLLRSLDRRPVLLLGPPLVGKTSLLHEYVWRIVASRKNPHKNRNNVWLLSPQRLISGMSYVGQWEERLLAILHTARRRQHILYFDDFLGLYLAGQSSSSELSVAHVLKPYVERREVRLVVEMTPEQFRVLREKDRGFADLFHVLRLDEPREQESLRILIAVARQLEGQHRCRFDLDVLPTAIDLQRRYVRHLSFPGKVAVFLRRLAVKHRKAAVTRAQALAEFQRQTGLSTTLLDTRLKLERREVIAALEQQVIGQPEALEVAANVVAIAKARLNDPERPLGALLFLGPTGVGKTQCAKALADYLYGGNLDQEGRENDPGRLLRFDMNEFIEAGSAARLVGTFWSPEGLLTSAVRRRPFAVILFDEIEKAHPEVFDLLLQVLGEGRLTDALGRTADFTNTLIVLTSNLGVREAQSHIGFRYDAEAASALYVQAAERFFRPEFFNRLDRIVPFRVLQRDDVARIARLLLRDLLRREGLVRRKCILHVQDEAMQRVIDQGYDPVLGARALKRALERLLTQPISTALAAGLPETITVIQVYQARDGLQVSVRGLSQVEPCPARPPLPEGEELIRRGRAALQRLEEEFAPLRPHGEITTGSLAGEHLRYFQLREHLDHIRLALRSEQEQLDERKLQQRRAPVLPVEPTSRGGKARWAMMQDFPPWRQILKGMAAALSIQEYIEEVAAAGLNVRSREDSDVQQRLTVAHLLAESCREPRPETVLVYVWSDVSAGGNWPLQMARHLLALFNKPWLGVEARTLGDEEDVRPWPGFALVVQGLTAWPVTTHEAGTHLVCPVHEGLVPIQVKAWPVTDGAEARQLLLDRLDERRSFQQRLAGGEATPADDPLSLEPVVRVYNEGGHTVDLRTGLTDQGVSIPLAFLLGALPLPLELSLDE